jgi:hypothetical protein
VQVIPNNFFGGIVSITNIVDKNELKKQSSNNNSYQMEI